MFQKPDVEKGALTGNAAGSSTGDPQPLVLAQGSIDVGQTQNFHFQLRAGDGSTTSRLAKTTMTNCERLRYV